MRTLLLLRHAKSAWPDGVKDIDRPLSGRGRRAAPVMAAHLVREGLRPDLVLVSPARRTRETLALMDEALAGVPLRDEPRIYEAPARRLLEVVHEVDPSVGCLLMIGHNPGMADLAHALAGRDSDPAALAGLRAGYPTAALAELAGPAAAWSAVAPGGLRLRRFVTPRSLGTDDTD